MIHINVRYIYLLFMVFGVLAFSAPTSEAIIKIMPLGDSITRGTGSSEFTGYRRELDLILTDEGYNFDFVGSLVEPLGLPNDFDKDHEGHGGWTAAELLEGRQSKPLAGNLTEWLAEYQPKIILLHIGTNDIETDTSATDVEAILDEIDSYESDNGPVWVLLARIINRNCITDEPDPCLESEKTTEFNNNVANMVQDRIILLGDKIHIVDMENGAGLDYNLTADNPPGDMNDNLHPNDMGYLKMADLWFSHIQQLTLPLANAGPDQSGIKETTSVILDGSGSSDPDGSIGAYLWEELTTSRIVITDSDKATASFIAPDVTAAGQTLTFRLTVTDDDGLSSSDTVDVTVVNRLSPVANAGSDQSDIKETGLVTLDGSGSNDPDGTIAAYLWQEITSSDVTIKDRTSATTTFTAPDVAAEGVTLTFQLTVTDDDGLQSTDFVNVGIVDRINPVAVADANPTNPIEAATVFLNGSNSSDTDGSITAYRWEELTTRGVAISNADTATASFIAPDVAAAGEILTFRLTVTDNDGLTSIDTLSVSVSDSPGGPGAGTAASAESDGNGGGGGGGGCFISNLSE